MIIIIYGVIYLHQIILLIIPMFLFGYKGFKIVRFIGGTTQHIKEIIEKKLKHSYIPNKSQLTTVEGLYKVAFKKYSNK